MFTRSDLWDRNESWNISKITFKSLGHLWTSINRLPQPHPDFCLGKHAPSHSSSVWVGEGRSAGTRGWSVAARHETRQWSFPGHRGRFGDGHVSHSEIGWHKYTFIGTYARARDSLWWGAKEAGAEFLVPSFYGLASKEPPERKAERWNHSDRIWIKTPETRVTPTPDVSASWAYTFSFCLSRFGLIVLSLKNEIVITHRT